MSRSTIRLLAILLVAAPAAAQDDPAEVEALRAEVARLEARLASLEARLDGLAEAPAPTEPPTVAATPPPLQVEETPAGATLAEEGALYLPSRGWLADMHYGAPDALMEVHAYLDLEYLDAGPGGARGGVSTFDNHHANLFVRSRLRDNLLAHVEAEWEHGGDEVEIDQAYVAWAIRDALTFTAGRVYAPFGIERFVQWSPTNQLVSRPQVMREIVPGNFYANGVVLSGQFGGSDESRFTYEAMVSDGLGDDADVNRRGSRQNRDNNSSRAITARGSYVFWPWFEVGASAHHQRYASDGDLDLDFLGLDVAGRYRGFELRAEWVDATVERGVLRFGELVRGPDLEQEGLYSQLAYRFDWDREFLPSVTLVGRYDDLDLDGASNRDDLSALSLGIKAEIYDHFKLKAEYQLFDEPVGTESADTLHLQAVVDF